MSYGFELYGFEIYGDTPIESLPSGAVYFTYPPLGFLDAYSQPSDQCLGRQLSVMFDSSNLHLDAYGNFISPLPTIMVFGNTRENPTGDMETFTFITPGDTVDGYKHFTTFENIAVNGYIINPADAYGVVEVKEILPLFLTDIQDGYTNRVRAFGSGIFVMDSYGPDGYGNHQTIDGYGDPSTGMYEFEYLSPLNIPINLTKSDVIIGNNVELNNPFDGVLDEMKLTSATAIKSRNRILSGSYDISAEATSPVAQEPDAKTLLLLHCDDNTQDIVDAIRDPLDSANLTDSTLETIVNLRNDRTAFISYVNSLNITGTLTEESIDTRPVSEQLYGLVSALNGLSNSANYFKVAGKFFPSEITVNNNFDFAASFVGESYSIDKVGLINDKAGSIELWIAPMFNTLGDLKTRVYFDIFNHALAGQSGNLTSISPRIIKLPTNIQAQQILSVKLYDDSSVNGFDFSAAAQLSSNGNVIVLDVSLPTANAKVVVDYIPLSSSNDRMTLYKDAGSNIVFALTAAGTTYSISHDISSWKKDTWHRVMVTWQTNTPRSLDAVHMYVDGIESSKIKYGQGFVFNTFVFNQEAVTTSTSRLIAQNIPLSGQLDTLNIGTAFNGAFSSMARLSNLRVSYITRQPVIDARGTVRDGDYGGGPISASPVVFDPHTTLLEDFDPKAEYVTKFASVPDIYAGIYDADIQIRDEFNLIRGVGNGSIERLVKALIKIAQPAHIRSKITVVK